MKVIFFKKMGVIKTVNIQKSIILVLVFFSIKAIAGNVGLPLQFYTESNVHSVDACLMVKENNISSEWLNLKTKNKNIIILRKVINSILNQDGKKLFKLSHNIHGKDIKLFKKQSEAFFKQFKKVTITDIPKLYEVDDLVIFYIKFKYKSNFFHVPFVFKYQKDKKLKFLPYSIKSVTLSLIEHWLSNPSKKYCNIETLKNTNYKILTHDDKTSINYSKILVKGSSMKNLKNIDNKNKIINFFISLREGLINNEYKKYTKLLTIEGSNRLKEWFKTADKNQIKAYKRSFMFQEPLFIFDLGRIFVVYTKSSQRGTEVFYLLNGKDLKWVNSSHITDVDSIFKRSRLIKSFELDVPFSDLKIK